MNEQPDSNSLAVKLTPYLAGSIVYDQHND